MPARVEQLKMKMDKPKDSGHLDFYGEFPLKKCQVGDTETITLKVKVTSVHQDNYSSGIGFEIKSAEKY